MTTKRIIGVAGMPGAGKEIVLDVFRNNEYPIVVMGDEIRAEAKQRGLKPNPSNIGKVMLKIRSEEGPGILARRCIPKIKAHNSPIVVIDGIRSIHEITEYRKVFPNFKTIGVHASPKTRFHRLVRRKRSDDPRNWETFVERDERELRVGLSEVIATSDYIIVNEGTIREFKNKVMNLVKRELKNEYNQQNRAHC